jgi:putative DNA primase/helicase
MVTLLEKNTVATATNAACPTCGQKGERRSKTQPTAAKQKVIRLSTCNLQDLPSIPLPTVVECLKNDESGDAELFSLVFKGLCIYDHIEKVWYMWEGHYWVRDDGNTVYHLVSGFLASVYLKAAGEVNLQIQNDGGTKLRDVDIPDDGEDTEEQQKRLKNLRDALIKRCYALKKIKRVRSILEFAMSDKAMHVPHQRSGKEVIIAWDRNIWLLGTMDGTLDLRTGELTAGRPTDYIRTVIPTRWRGLDEPCPRFERFLREIFSDRPKPQRETLIHFLHKVLGYGITGSVEHHLFLALIGEGGRNGKDTLMTRLERVLGKSTSGPVSKELMIAPKFGNSPGAASPHKMSLQGKRIAWCEETDKGDTFNIAALKEYTGGGSIRARGLRENEQTFDATHLLILMTNNPPHADAKDKAFWERICPIMFNVRFVDNPDPSNQFEHKPDRKLGTTLDEEGSGILAWLVRGCLLWQQEGLEIPEEVLQERVTYKKNEDTIGKFIEECCVQRPECQETGSSLYTAYYTWAKDSNGLKPLNGIAFARDLEKRFKKTRPKNIATYHGIGLRSNYTVYAIEDDKRVDTEVQQAEEAEQQQRDTNDALRLLEIIDAHDSRIIALTYAQADGQEKNATAKELHNDFISIIHGDNEANKAWMQTAIQGALPSWRDYVLKHQLFNFQNIELVLKE